MCYSIDAQAEMFVRFRTLKTTQKEEEKKQEKIIPQISQEMLDKVEQEINSMHTVGLQFSVHKETGRTMIKAIDKNTQEVIREFPPERMLDLAARMEEMLGILFDKKM